MPGPPPKPPGERRRRNKEAKSIVLGKSARKPPKLPKPMASEWLEADVPALARLAGMIHRANRAEPTVTLILAITGLEDR